MIGNGEFPMYTTVIERFPEYSELITQLMRQDVKFAEICSEYEELANWLMDHSHEGSTPNFECAVNRLLLKEMEVEILQYFQAEERKLNR